jgi:hypothetical protein
MVVPVADARDVLWKKLIDRIEPFGWVLGEPRVAAREITIVNRVVFQFRATAKQSTTSKSPLAGLDWHWAVPDEEAYMDEDAMREISARGRVNPDYQVFSSATNEPIHAFQMRLAKRKADPRSKIIRYEGTENCFVSLEHWEALKDDFSDEDYKRYVLCQDVPRAGRVYPTFAYDASVRPVPARGDITAQVVESKFRGLTGIQWLVGWDPGTTMSASGILKCFDAGAEERNWYVIDEVSTKDATTEWHGRDLARWFQQRGIDLKTVLVIGDPHENKDTDRSDYLQMQTVGFAAVKRSNSGETIERRHRVSMMNALLGDANGRRRLFLAASATGPAKAAKTAESLAGLMYKHNGEIDFHGKTYLNLAHWTDNIGYGLFPFEHFRGSYRSGTSTTQSPTPIDSGPRGGYWRQRRGA